MSISSGRGVMAIAHQQHGMVHGGIPAATIKDAGLVVAPRFAIHGDHHRALLDGHHQRLQLIHRQAHEAASLHHRRSHLSLTAARGLRVPAVRRLRRQPMLRDVFKGQLSGGPQAAAVAAAVLRIRHTIQELLVG